jgi:hypothetical protein
MASNNCDCPWVDDDVACDGIYENELNTSRVNVAELRAEFLDDAGCQCDHIISALCNAKANLEANNLEEHLRYVVSMCSHARESQIPPNVVAHYAELCRILQEMCGILQEPILQEQISSIEASIDASIKAVLALQQKFQDWKTIWPL